MSDIELVIKVPEKLVCEGFERPFTEEERKILINAIGNGVLLPKEHGDLVDKNDLLVESYWIDDWSGNEVKIVDVMTIKMAQTIIESNEENEEE